MPPGSRSGARTGGAPRLPLVASLLLGGCTFAATQEDWQSQLQADGACYRANLLDGLDETSTQELHDVFACVDSTGALHAYEGLDTALDGETRDGTAGLVLARWVNDLPTADLSLRSLLDTALDVLADPTGLFDALHLGLELVYAAPWPWLGTSVPLNSRASLDGGLLVPALPIVGAVSGAVLDDDLAPLDPIADALRSDTTKRALWTVASIGTSSDRTLSSFEENWAADLADGIDRTADGSNDRWADASGNSVRDLVTLLYTRISTDGRIRLDHLMDPAAPLLADTRLRDALGQVLADQADAGRLDVLPSQLLYLASVDVEGGTLTAGEDSALVALIRLLHDGDTEVDCSIDLVFFDAEFSLGNLSEDLLVLLAHQDPGTVDTGVGLLGDLLGVSLTDDILDAVADSGVCPVIDTQLVSDLHAVDRLNDPAADDLLLVLLDVLAAFDDQGEVPALVDTLGAAHVLGVVPPLEEVLRDTADTALADDLVSLLPVLLSPDDYHDPAYFPAAYPPLDFPAAWDAAAAALEQDADGITPLGSLAEPVQAAILRDDTWELLQNLGELLAEPDALVGGALPMVADLCEADPSLDALDQVADTLDDHALVEPLLVLVEADPLRDALGETELLAEGPVPFTAKLVQGGTLDLFLDTISILTSLLPEDPG